MWGPWALLLQSRTQDITSGFILAHISCGGVHAIVRESAPERLRAPEGPELSAQAGVTLQKQGLEWSPMHVAKPTSSCWRPLGLRLLIWKQNERP